MFPEFVKSAVYYDDNGKLWKVYSKMGDAGSGYNYQNKNYEDISLPVPLTRPMSPDITYSYTKRNEVENISYNSAYANKQIFYNPMGWVDELIVNRDGQQIFKQILDRDDMGMISQQKSKHTTYDEKTINYTYDNLNRLTEWQNQVNNNGQTFNYDDIGNRTGSTDNGLDLSYLYNTGTNQLSEVNKGQDSTFNFAYNSYGAVTSVIKKYQANIIKQETWEYVNSTVPKIYSKTVGSDVWKWRYRRGAFDTREQKRLVFSPLGDGGDNGDAYAQSWEYSLTGVAGEELVLYKGIQTTKTAVVWPLNNGQTDEGRRVYMAMSRFFVAGTELQYLPSGNKELHITDNQGNVRTIFEVYTNSTIRSFDYKPFGEKEWTSVPEDSDRKGFAGSEYDSESDYYAMGYRMYSAEFGRFLSVDPLFEAMPRHNPYHYSFNSPMFWSDPSGLVPVKEKVKNGEKLQMFEQDWGRIIESYNDYVASQNYGITSKTIAYKIRTTTFRIGAVAYGDNGVPYYTQANGYDVTFTEIIYEGSSYSMSWSISNQDGSLEYCESGKSIDGKWLVDNREFNVTTAEGVNQDQWLTGLQIALDTYGTFDQGFGGFITGVASGIIDLYRGNYVDAGISLLSAAPVVGIVGDMWKAGRNAERVASNITKFTKRLKDGSAYMKELQIPDGYRIVKGVFSEGAEVFTNGKVFISPDVTSHNGAIWKMAKKVEWLKNPSKRMGGYDELLNWIHK